MLPTGDKTVVSTRVFSRFKEGAGRLYGTGITFIVL